MQGSRGGVLFVHRLGAGGFPHECRHIVGREAFACATGGTRIATTARRLAPFLPLRLLGHARLALALALGVRAGLML
ncbi:MAG: hypothetical protein AB1749_11810, partial [Pseudomonadota bacterium]